MHLYIYHKLKPQLSAASQNADVHYKNMVLQNHIISYCMVVWLKLMSPPADNTVSTSYCTLLTIFVPCSFNLVRSCGCAPHEIIHECAIQ